MNDCQIVTISFFRFSGLGQRWWALQQMGRVPHQLKQVEGLAFGKVLGSGSGNGFHLLPNLGVYGLLGVWENERAAQHFFKQHPIFHHYQQRSTEYYTVFLRTAMSHGRWDGVAPFTVTTSLPDDQPVAVLTRATIRTRHLRHFWRFVPAVSQSVEKCEGRLFSVGIGELPIVQQATFSLWTNSRLMKAYAYQNHYHRQVVQKTRELGWYQEELFARFVPYATEGSWQGENPLAQFL